MAKEVCKSQLKSDTQISKCKLSKAESSYSNSEKSGLRNLPYDVLILGAGPAGMTAAIYSGRYNLRTLVIGKSVGGTANLAGEVENWPGFVGSGIELMRNVWEQATSFGSHFLDGNIEKVEKLGCEIRKGLTTLEELNRSAIGRAHASHGDLADFEVTVDGKVFRGRSVIVALGTEHRQLNVPGEKEFLGKGVSYCATCDGNFFKGKTVAVVGGADSAAKAAIYLADICEKVYVVYRKHEMRCEPVSLSKICSTPNIEIVYYSVPTEVVGSQRVEKLRILTDSGQGEVGGSGERLGKERVLDVDGVFIEAGALPVVEVVKDLGLKMEGDYIVTDKKCGTNVDGVFAAGDVTNNFLKQMVTAAGEGAVAGKGAWEFLMGK